MLNTTALACMSLICFVCVRPQVPTPGRERNGASEGRQAAQPVLVSGRHGLGQEEERNGR